MRPPLLRPPRPHFRLSPPRRRAGEASREEGLLLRAWTRNTKVGVRRTVTFASKRAAALGPGCRLPTSSMHMGRAHYSDWSMRIRIALPVRFSKPHRHSEQIFFGDSVRHVVMAVRTTGTLEVRFCNDCNVQRFNQR